MENLLQKDPSINLVYTINEPAAAGAYEGLKAAGKDFVDTGVTLITDKPVDGVESKDTAFGLENCWG